MIHQIITSHQPWLGGLVWFGFGLVWFGLVWFGLVWFGLVWFWMWGWVGVGGGVVGVVGVAEEVVDV